MAKHETIADIIAEKRREAGKLEASSYRPHQFLRERIAELRREADRLEAAYKRERAKIEADALDVGGILGAAHMRELSKNVSKNGADFGQLGDAAKLREAVGYIAQYADSAAMRQHDATTQHYIEQMRKWATAALAAPPRNCDRFNSGDPEKDAQDAWDALGPKDSHISEMKDDFLTALTWLFRKAKKEKVNRRTTNE